MRGGPLPLILGLAAVVMTALAMAPPASGGYRLAVAVVAVLIFAFAIYTYWVESLRVFRRALGLVVTTLEVYGSPDWAAINHAAGWPSGLKRPYNATLKGYANRSPPEDERPMLDLAMRVYSTETKQSLGVVAFSEFDDARRTVSETASSWYKLLTRRGSARFFGWFAERNRLSQSYKEPLWAVAYLEIANADKVGLASVGNEWIDLGARWSNQ